MSLQGVITFISLVVSLVVNILFIVSFYIDRRKDSKANKDGIMIGDYFVTGSILRCYKSFLGRVHFGKPLTEEFPAAKSKLYGTQGHVQRFEGYGDDVEFERNGRKFRGISIYKSKRGTFGVYGNIGQAFEEIAGGTSSKLGYPTSNEIWKNGNVMQRFEGGRIYGDKRIEYTN